MCKHTIRVGEAKEIVAPFGQNVVCGTSELGEIFVENGVQYMRFDRICLKDNKELDSIHSGNTNAFKLPLPLPPFSFLREKIEN
ncbi:collagenase family protease [Helicobacter cinaedi]|uniref:Collagenase family protease n=1 Tax=Helicobacter cinaedi TaxID=213 RepID=A0A377JSY8_9HELI|nr:collagenase family protease [Helicobacter cinaedi]